MKKIILSMKVIGLPALLAACATTPAISSIDEVVVADAL